MLFLLYAYVFAQKEGLRNYMPIIDDEQIYGVNLVREHDDHILNRLLNPKDPLYQERFKTYLQADIVKDMQYFNNASFLMNRL